MFDVVAAMDENRGIGIRGTIPWNIPQEMEYFHELTTTTTSNSKQNVVIMGRGTWESIPESHRPMNQRINIVLSHQKLSLSIPVVSSITKALEYAESLPNVAKIFIIGGESVYKKAIHHPLCKNIYLTVIHDQFECDRFFPVVNETKFIENKIGEMHAEEKTLQKSIFIEFFKWIRR